MKFLALIGLFSLLSCSPSAEETSETSSIGPTGEQNSTNQEGSVESGNSNMTAKSVSAQMHALPTTEAWRNHISNDLMPFWTLSDALGQPVGDFPTERCNSGALPDPAAACDEVGKHRAEKPIQKLVAQSRLVFSYAAAFHTTGDPDYLNYALKGLDYQLDNMVDPETGIFDTSIAQRNSQPDGKFEPGTAQMQSYGMLGLTFVYYLTRDQALFEKIRDLESAITLHFHDNVSGGYYRLPNDNEPSVHLVDHLDQINAYKYLLSTVAPEPYRAEYQNALLKTAYYIKDNYFDESTGLFKLDRTQPDGIRASIDFGHTAKTFWFLDLVGGLTGEEDLVAFSRTHGEKLFAMAYQQESGAWSYGYDQSGEIKQTVNWWIYSELDQFAAHLSLSDTQYVDYSAKTNAFWLTKFVDNEFKGVWSTVDLVTGRPSGNQKKQWEWKSGFHALEHALVGLISSAAVRDEPVVLYFAINDENVIHDRAYTFGAASYKTDQMSPAFGQSIQRVTFSEISNR